MKILRVDVEQETVMFEDLPAEWLLIGGSGLIARIMTGEVPPEADPLGPDNKFIITTGPFAGTMAPMSGRVSIGGKSPLTYGIKEANAGGSAGQKMDKLGVRAIIVQGTPKDGKLYYLSLNHQGAELIPADAYKGMNTYPLAEQLQAKHGDRASLICIGTAGERKYRSASVSFTDILGDPSRNAARGGLGAVMGARGLKAVVVDATGASRVPLADSAAFKKATRDWVNTIQHDIGCGLFSKFGTPFAVINSSYAGTMPANNYTSGKPERFKELSAETIQKTIYERGGKMHACMAGCIVQCSIIYNDEKKDQLAGAYEYENLTMLGSNLGIYDLDAIGRLKHICDNIGIDMIEAGAVLAVAVSAGKLKLGDAETAEKLLMEIEQGTELGKTLADGVVATAKAFNVDRVPAMRGQAIPGHDPRAVKGTGVTYATSPAGADHTAGLTYRKAKSRSGQAANSLRFQIEASACDVFAYCLNAVPAPPASLFEYFAKLANARFGTDVTDIDIMDIAKQALREQVEYNRKTEFYTKHDAVPAFIREEPLEDSKETFDIDPEELETIWDGLESYQETKKIWETRIPKIADVLVGPGVFQKLGASAKKLNVKKFMIVSDPFMHSIGRTAEIQALLETAGLDSCIFAEVEPDPPVAAIEKAGRFYRENNCEGIIAIGGGSSMDSGKAIAFRVSHDGPLYEYESIMGGTAKIKDVIPPVITIPTTSGTGSDINPYAVVTDTDRDAKFTLFSEYLLPRLAVIDPVICSSMPPSLTAETGVDALSHCIEAYVALGTPYQPYCDAMAMQGARMVGRSLRKAFADGNNIDARMDMCMAAIFGGVAFVKSLGLGHAIGHAVGAQHHVPHGKAVAVGLLIAVRANRKYCESKYEELAWAIDRGSDLEESLLSLYQDLNMQTSLKGLGVPESGFRRIAFAASREVANIASNPAPMTENKILKMLA